MYVHVFEHILKSIIVHPDMVYIYNLQTSDLEHSRQNKLNQFRPDNSY